MPSTLLEQCVHEKLKPLPEGTAGQVGYSSANVCKNLSQTGISKCHILSCSFARNGFFFWEVAVLLPLLAVAHFSHSCVVSCPRFGFALRVVWQGQKTDHWGWMELLEWSSGTLQRWRWCLIGTVMQRVTSHDPCGSFQLSPFCDCSAVIVFSLDHSSQWWSYHREQVWEWDLIQHNLLVGSTPSRVWQAMHPHFFLCSFFFKHDFYNF